MLQELEINADKQKAEVEIRIIDNANKWAQRVAAAGILFFIFGGLAFVVELDVDPQWSWLPLVVLFVLGTLAVLAAKKRKAGLAKLYVVTLVSFYLVSLIVALATVKITAEDVKEDECTGLTSSACWHTVALILIFIALAVTSCCMCCTFCGVRYIVALTEPQPVVLGADTGPPLTPFLKQQREKAEAMEAIELENI